MCTSYSASTLQHTDSTKVAINDLRDATNALIELEGYDSINHLQAQEITVKNVQIGYLDQALKKSEEINATFKYNIVPELIKQDSLHNQLYTDFKKSYKKEKTKAIISSSIGIPAIAILSFILGFYLHK